MSFGPGSAFSFAAPTRPPRRAGSSGSFKDAAAAPSLNGTSSLLAGPAPVDPPAAPSLGSFERDVGGGTGALNGGFVNGQGHLGQDSGSSRSFSSILSPSLAATANGGQLGENGATDAAGKPFVYSREFLLSLYDEEKAKKRPIELAVHDTATRDLGRENGGNHKPWVLQEYREGEKELFSTSIHPANARPSRINRTDSTPGANGSSATLDLSTLGTLPRDRDRNGLGSPSIRSPSVEKDGILGSAGRERRTRERSAGGTMGIMGGVLGGIANGTPTRKREESGGANGGKEVWQGGRWRRGAQQEAEEAEKRTSAFGSRRFPLADENGSRPASPGGDVPESWDDGDDKAPTGSSALNGDVVSDALANEPEITASLLGSLALDSDLGDDPLLAKPASGAQTPAIAGPPPGLASIPPAQVEWQYRDPSGQVQGPFQATMMHDWYRQQFFTPDLRVKRTTDLDFESLENLIRRVGDSEKPFLAPKPSAPTSAFSSAPGTPQGAASWGGASARAQTPLEQLTSAVAQGRFGAAGSTGANSLYEPFGSAAASPAQQAQTLPQAFGGAGASALGRTPSTQSSLDPWNPSLSSPSVAPAWNPLTGAVPQHQQLFGQQQQQQQQQIPAHSPADLLLRQLAHQQQAAQQPFGGQNGVDVFGRPSPLPASPFFDPSQLVGGNAAMASPTAWIGQQLPQQQQAQFAQQAQQLAGQPWSGLAGATAAIGSPVVQLQQQAQGVPSAAAGVPTPIGPPSAVASTQQSPIAQQQPAPAAHSPWDAIAGPAQQQQQAAPVVEVKETVVVAEPKAPAAAPEDVAVVEEVKVEAAPAAAPKKEKKEKKAAPAAQPLEVAPTVAEIAPVVVAPEPSVSPASAAKAAAAPWAKDEAAPAVATATPSPSLREIQEAEAREADKRKQAARIQAAQANIQAAQRAAALEAAAAAESLPPSASWAAGPAQVPPVKAAPAPWIKPAASLAAAGVTKPAGKTLKEIQEEEERRKKAQEKAQQAAVAGGAVPAGRGYAGVTTAVPGVGGAWTTVAVKPAVARPAAPAAKPLIPGLPSTATTATAVRAAGATGLPVKAPAPAPVVRPAAPAASPAPAAKVTIVPRSVSIGSSPATTVYDMENPPPPSAEFMSWTKQALKGLTVPLDEFVQMLLSFPLESSADVLEIISDSVYANSSTLDGRRFAHDFTTRRKNDVAVRYPSIFAKGAVRTAGKPSSMASVLAATQNQPKTSEWNVKVSAKKKKGGK
ncbi:hypothetical protein JCM6882_002017 [Rhodosporidiobolus microsporus]